MQLFGTPRRLSSGTEVIHPEYVWRNRGFSGASAHAGLSDCEWLGQSTWRKLCGQALAALTANRLKIYWGITADRITLSEAIAFLHNLPPGTELDPIHGGVHLAQIRLAREELIAHQLTVQGVRDTERNTKRRLSRRPLNHSTVHRWLPFAPTAAQMRVAKELKADMAQPQPMLRLVQGDVGLKNTVAAQPHSTPLLPVRLAPTELLAEQHHANLQVGWMN